MKYSYTWLKEIVPGIPSPAKLAELFTFHSFEVEHVKKIRKDVMLDIDVLPNRIPDVSGHEGLAREAAALCGKKAKIPPLKIREQGKEIAELLQVRVLSPQFCSRYTARVLEDVRVRTSPAWLRERLVTCGIKPVNNLVDAANYVMLATGQPLHVFDYNKIAGGKIFVRLSRREEQIISLDRETYMLPAGTLVIADRNGPIAIAGIKGGLRTGVDNKTTRIVLESANFDRAIIRQTVKKLALSTDASVRFSAGLDPALALRGLNKLASFIHATAGGKIQKGIIDTYKNSRKKYFVLVRLSEASALLGIKLRMGEIKQIVKRLGFIVHKEKKEESLLLEAPPFRMDIENEPDVIEEVGRVKGYQQIRARPYEGAFAYTEPDRTRFLLEKLRALCSQAGFTETMNYIFMQKKHMHCFQTNTNRLLELENPVSDQEKYLRHSLLGGLLKNIEHNRNYRGELLFFEIGEVFSREEKKHKEETQCMAVLSENIFQKKSPGRMGEELFFEAKGLASSILEQMGIADYQFVATSSRAAGWPHTLFELSHPFRYTHISVGGHVVGALFEVHPEVLRCFGVRRRVIAIEFSTLALLRCCEAEKEFHPISKYPSVVRDIAVLVPADTRVDEVLNIIERIGGVLLVDTDLFDFYEGDHVGGGMKSFGFHLIFQSVERTLTDKEIDAIIQNITRVLSEEKDWEIR